MRNFTAAKAVTILLMCGCVPSLEQQEPRQPNKSVPESFGVPSDGPSAASAQWEQFFDDPALIELVDLALKNNQELNIAIQEINIANNEVLARSGEYMPRLDLQAGAGVEKVGRYTSQGASDEADEITPGRNVPEVLPNYFFGFRASWEVDIWKRLRNATKAAAFRYLASIEGRNFAVTSLVAEIGTLYYELMALDNQLIVLKQNIELQTSALEIVRLEKRPVSPSSRSSASKQRCSRTRAGNTRSSSRSPRPRTG